MSLLAMTSGYVDERDCWLDPIEFAGDTRAMNSFAANRIWWWQSVKEVAAG